MTLPKSLAPFAIAACVGLSGCCSKEETTDEVRKPETPVNSTNFNVQAKNITPDYNLINFNNYNVGAVYTIPDPNNQGAKCIVVYGTNYNSGAAINCSSARQPQ